MWRQVRMSQSALPAQIHQPKDSARRKQREASAQKSAGTECPECSGDVVRDDRRGEITCNSCGLVLESGTVDHGPEWRSYQDDDTDPRRTGAALDETLHDRGLSTQIGWRDKDAYGKLLSGPQRSRVRRLRKWNTRYQQDSDDRHLKHAFGEIKRMGSALGLSKPVREVATVTYRRAHQENLLLGRSVEGVASGCLAMACRQSGIPTGFAEITNVSHVGEDEIVSAYKHVIRELGLEVPPPNPKEYIPRFASEFGVSDAIERRAVELLEAAVDATYHSGKNPRALAASAIYLADQLGDKALIQREVAEAAGVTDVTIRSQRDALLNLCPDEVKQ